MASEHRRRAREIAERLGMTLLLERLGPPADVWTLARDGEVWVLDAGGEHARLRDSRGLHYLRALLAAPGKDIRALDLVAGGAGLPGLVGLAPFWTPPPATPTGPGSPTSPRVSTPPTGQATG